MHLAHYLGLLHRAQIALGETFGTVAQAHRDEADVYHTCRRLAEQCGGHAAALEPFTRRYGEDGAEPQSARFCGPRSGGMGLLRDLHDLYLMAAECDLCWTVVGQAAQGARDTGLVEVVRRCEGETAVQLAWLRTRIKQAAPQALVVAE